MYHVYSDGACINNGLPNAVASWSYVVTDENDSIVQACTGRVEGKQDNNRAELIAYINVLRYIKDNKGQYIVHVDYEALYLYCNGKSRPKSNLDLYREIDRLHSKCSVKLAGVVKVQAHRSKSSVVNFINGLVDKLARRSIEFFGEGGVKATLSNK